MFKNYKTTLAGILTMSVGILGLFGISVTGTDVPTTQADIGFIIAGLTGLFAHDGV